VKAYRHKGSKGRVDTYESDRKKSSKPHLDAGEKRLPAEDVILTNDASNSKRADTTNSSSLTGYIFLHVVLPMQIKAQIHASITFSTQPIYTHIMQLEEGITRFGAVFSLEQPNVRTGDRI
jgi:hypothetical protein